MKKLFRLCQVKRGHLAPYFEPLYPFELGTKKIINGKEFVKLLVPYRNFKLKIGEYVILDEDFSKWKLLKKRPDKEIYVAYVKVASEKELTDLIYEKELYDNQNLTDVQRKLVRLLSPAMAKAVKKHRLSIPKKFFDAYWWNALLNTYGIKYVTPVKSWSEKDYLNIYKILKEKELA